MLLIEKGRHEDSVWILLRCLEMDKKDEKAKNQLMEVFKKLGGANESVKKGRKQLASLMF